jgi:hypothetical protein
MVEKFEVVSDVNEGAPRKNVKSVSMFMSSSTTDVFQVLELPDQNESSEDKSGEGEVEPF